MKLFSKVLQIALCGLVVASCGSLPTQELKPDIFYRRDMRLEINGKPYEGVAVVDHEPVYEINFHPRGHLDLLLITTCHREDSFRTDQSKAKAFQYIYQPTPNVEDQGSCELRVNAYDKEKGEHSWGFVAFRTRETTLKAAATCNGEVRHMVGTSVCQSKKGLIQRIEFDEQVMVAPDERCPLKRLSDREFEYAIEKGECVYLFSDPKVERLHKHITIGYEQVLVRSVE